MNDRNQSENDSTAKDDEYRRLEREWQNEVGQHLLDKPHEIPGSLQVFKSQFQRIIDKTDLVQPGTIVEIGCGKGHFLEFLKDTAKEKGVEMNIVGIDISEAVNALPGKGLMGLCADGEALPFTDGSLQAVVYDGALHHLIDFKAALAEAYRALAPGGRFIIFEPVSSVFTRTIHRVLDPLIFKKVEYESPIDQEYKDHFREQDVISALKALNMESTTSRSDFLAYPLTGCYAGSFFSRYPKFMAGMLAIEAICEKIPPLRWFTSLFSWRFLLVAQK